jgi:NAD(P)-binding Rossmann-like domain
MSTSISRAQFLKGLAGLAAAGLCGGALTQVLRKSRPNFPSRMLGPSRDLGHLLRDPGQLAKLKDKPSERAACKVAIVGGGMAGLSAAWWLNKNGFHDFKLLELEKDVGGNAASGKNQYGSYPWGAHYIPIPNKESTYVRSLLEELSILQGYDKKGEPIYDALTLCHEPQERLFKDGSFHEGLVPRRGLQENEKTEMARFFAMVQEFRQAVGSDGKPAFAIPLDLSSQDPKFTCLDKISMSQWLKENKFETRPLLWYTNYCCRDDYGSTLEYVSAWAGIHYFAGRRGTAANAEQNAVLTWPQGNGYIAGQLRQRLESFIETGALVTEVKNTGDKVLTTYMKNGSTQAALESDYVIFAAPRFIGRHIITDSTFHSAGQPALNYAPWLVANISLKRLPSARGAAPSWDNVSYYSDSLGYVMADHQDITTRQKPCVITYYYPLSGENPKDARNMLYASTPEKWSEIIVKDLARMHPEIEDQIISMDLWPWGHGMIRPDVGYIWGEDRKKMKASAGRIFFAHSDMSGISNFEEAQYHGVEAAKSIIGQMPVG